MRIAEIDYEQIVTDLKWYAWERGGKPIKPKKLLKQIDKLEKLRVD